MVNGDPAANVYSKCELLEISEPDFHLCFLCLESNVLIRQRMFELTVDNHDSVALALLSTTKFKICDYIKLRQPNILSFTCINIINQHSKSYPTQMVSIGSSSTNFRNSPKLLFPAQDCKAVSVRDKYCSSNHDAHKTPYPGWVLWNVLKRHTLGILL